MVNKNRAQAVRDLITQYKLDIVILNKADQTSVYCILEIKKHQGKDGKEVILEIYVQLPSGLFA
jgi:hypothetical protein